MYRSIKWESSSPLTSERLMQMVQNDKENYVQAVSSAGPMIAMSVMTQRFETMPGNNPTRIPMLSIDTFRAPYTGWYKAHFSCAAAKQEVTNTIPSTTPGTPATGLPIRDGFYFVITCKRSSRTPVASSYDPKSGISNFDISVGPHSPSIGSIVARASFVQSGIVVPTAATGYRWLEKGETVSWHIYTYIANNNWDTLGSPDRHWGRIIVNGVTSSNTQMGSGAPRVYNAGGGTGTPAFNDGLGAGLVIGSVFQSNDNPNRKSSLSIQFVGQGGVPDPKYRTDIEKQIFEELNDVNITQYEV